MDVRLIVRQLYQTEARKDTRSRDEDLPDFLWDYLTASTLTAQTYTCGSWPPEKRTPTISNLLQALILSTDCVRKGLAGRYPESTHEEIVISRAFSAAAFPGAPNSGFQPGARFVDP